MSSMRDLLEKMTFAGQAVGQKPGDQVRGSEPLPRKGGGKKHPYAGRLVGDGAAESVETQGNILKELSAVIDKNPVQKDLYAQWQEFKKLNEQGITDRIRPIKDPADPDNYDKIRFQKLEPDGNIIDIQPYSGSHRHYYKAVTGKDPDLSPQSKEMFDVLKNQFKKQQSNAPKQYQKFEVPQSPDIQDIPVRLKQKTYEPDDDVIGEYGAPGSAIGNDTANNPAEQAAMRQQQVAQKQELKNQISGLVAQVNGARAQLSQLNKSFPQGANPVEKAMALKDIQGQKVGIQNQIEDLMSQIAAMRSQAL